MDIDLAASIVIKNKNNVWIEDNRVTACYSCRIVFSFFIRKHHCRNCGNVFCHDCSNYYIQIPHFITDAPDPADYWNISYYVTYLKSALARVCKQCYVSITEKINCYKKIATVFQNPPSIDRIRALNDSNVDLKNHYFDHLRNIQYYLPNHCYSMIDKKILLANAPYFSKHSKYLVHLIKSMDWSNDYSTSIGSFIALSNGAVTNNQCTTVCRIIEGQKKKSCTELYCTRTCGEDLSTDDCIHILYSPNSASADNLPEPLLAHLFERMNASSEQVILCNLYFFVLMIKNSNRAFTHQLIYSLLTRTIKSTYYTYWFCTNALLKCTVFQTENINLFFNLWDNDLLKRLNGEYQFFNGLLHHLADARTYLMREFNPSLAISLPYDPHIKLKGVDLDSIAVKTSYTKPIMITFVVLNTLTHITSNIKLLFKKECVANDVIALNLIKLCDAILVDSLDNRFSTVVYPVMPIGTEGGMIQIVEQSETIHSIMNKECTILQHIINNSNQQIVADVLTRYMISLVSYTLHNYLIGLGDRHLENIMISGNGQIFHIDFGFILGTDSYPSSGLDIKLNSAMLDVIGGHTTTLYQDYLRLCSEAIIYLRKYFNMFFILLSIETKFKEKQIETFVLSRFQPRQVDRVVVEQLMAIIKQSNSAYTDYIKDFLHYHSQERTLQNGLSRFLDVF